MKNRDDNGRFVNGHGVSEESRRKIALTLKGRKLSEETKRKMSLAMKGNTHCLGRKHSEESKAKMSESRQRHTVTKETKQKMSLAHTGKKMSEEHRKNISLAMYGKTDEKHSSWKGDKVGYSGLHTWVRKHLGKPLKCEHCSKENKPAKDGRYKFVQWANKSHEYKRDLMDWLALCVPCHKKYDKI